MLFLFPSSDQREPLERAFTILPSVFEATFCTSHCTYLWYFEFPKSFGDPKRACDTRLLATGIDNAQSNK
jgi:hypothetical protein